MSASNITSISTVAFASPYASLSGNLLSSGYFQGNYCKFGSVDGHFERGLWFMAGRTKAYYPGPAQVGTSIISPQAGLEIFFNIVEDDRNIYHGFAGETTFLNYNGGMSYGGFSFRNTSSGGLFPNTTPSVMFEMIAGKNFCIYSTK